ncbi:hypothetical protein TNCV_3055221 [Trichonephila clavipes]|nr:hypothetical protein TNCV_3055221 [Trichonephila clavipes]
MIRIGQQKRCCVPLGQRQSTYFCSDSPEPLGACRVGHFLEGEILWVRVTDMLMTLYAIKVVSPRRWQCSTKANLPNVADGLSNGPVGKLCYVERDENHDIIRIWGEISKTMWTKTSYKIEESNED